MQKKKYFNKKITPPLMTHYKVSKQNITTDIVSNFVSRNFSISHSLQKNSLLNSQLLRVTCKYAEDYEFDREVTIHE